MPRTSRGQSELFENGSALRLDLLGLFLVRLGVRHSLGEIPQLLGQLLHVTEIHNIHTHNPLLVGRRLLAHPFGKKPLHGAQKRIAGASRLENSDALIRIISGPDCSGDLGQLRRDHVTYHTGGIAKLPGMLLHQLRTLRNDATQGIVRIPGRRGLRNGLLRRLLLACGEVIGLRPVVARVVMPPIGYGRRLLLHALSTDDGRDLLLRRDGKVLRTVFRIALEVIDGACGIELLDKTVGLVEVEVHLLRALDDRLVRRVPVVVEPDGLDERFAEIFLKRHVFLRC